MSTATPDSGRMPRQIPYIIANEACERFSFYGMRNILTNFLISSMILAYLPESERAAMSKEVFHTFVIGVYFFPLLGGWLADRVFGKYRTIFWFSILYCIGQFSLAFFVESRIGFYSGLALVALGSGGIKPLVASFMGDQFDQSNKHKAKLVFDAFYWIINFGSFFASLFMPIFLREYGPGVAFGVPGVLMVIATFFFWLGRRKYVHVAPAPRDPDAFLNVSLTALKSKRAGESNPGSLLGWLGIALALASFFFIGQIGFVSAFCLAIVFVIALGGIGTSLQLERARGLHPDEAVDGVRAVLRILIVFALTTPFWSLFDQKASTWVLQGNSMAMPQDVWWWPSMLVKDAAQMQALNPILVMLLIPFNNVVLYPLLNRIGLQVTALRRMGFGIAFSGVAWVFAGILQLWLDQGDSVSLAWQIAPYALLTFGEVLVSATGLEFAYSQAPARMKGVIMAFWYLAVTIGNLWVLLANSSIKHPAVLAKVGELGLSANAFLMFFFAGFALVCAAIFALYARVYPMQDNYRSM
ncbi:MAG: MFS transporter [Xanthomonadales bacterium]|nr:MFS transporter [Xanthomonadales bacterium]